MPAAGGIPAAGGAWNASIVAEIVSYGGTTRTATGQGAYIADATCSRGAGRILIGSTRPTEVGRPAVAKPAAVR